MKIELFNYETDFEECVNIAHENLRKDDNQDVRVDLNSYIKGKTDAKNSIIFVIRDFNKIISFGSYCDFLSQKNAFWICWMNVRKSYQNMGYGKVLMEHILSDIDKKCVDNKKILSTYNKEIFYEKFGFKHVGFQNGEKIMIK